VSCKRHVTQPRWKRNQCAGNKHVWRGQLVRQGVLGNSSAIKEDIGKGFPGPHDAPIRQVETAEEWLECCLELTEAFNPQAALARREDHANPRL
jgi:hypothetical protein